MRPLDLNGRAVLAGTARLATILHHASRFTHARTVSASDLLHLRLTVWLLTIMDETSSIHFFHVSFPFEISLLP